LPSHAFRPSDTLKIVVMEQETEITLNSIKEHTGSFTQFQFTSQVKTDVIERKQKSSTKNKDEYDEIWSSL